VIVADTSAWIEFLRGTSHPVAATLRTLIGADADLAVTEVVVMELLAGARSGRHLRELRSTLLSFPLLPLEGPADFEEAAVIYRSCRSAGETLRGLTDCLIAVPAIRAEAELLHNDGDFEVIARHAGLRVRTPEAPER
jgi:predicted nucleic acid-binding protein